MITSSITIPDSEKIIIELLQKQLDGSFGNRATSVITHSKKNTIVTITAHDPTALRALLNAVCKVLAVHTAMQTIK